MTRTITVTSYFLYFKSDRITMLVNIDQFQCLSYIDGSLYLFTAGDHQGESEIKLGSPSADKVAALLQALAMRQEHTIEWVEESEKASEQ